MRRLLLIRHGGTSAVRQAAFAAGEPLEAAARDRARRLGATLPSTAAAVAGPEPACHETAACLGVTAEAVAELAGCDVGRWRGSTLAELETRDPAGMMAWLTDPDATPHGGESLTACAGRIAAWLDGAARGSGVLVAVVDAAVVRAAVCTALGAPLSAFWRIDVAPLNVTELHARDGRWTVRRVNASLARIPAATVNPRPAHREPIS